MMVKFYNSSEIYCLDDLAEKKKASLQKDESAFEYVMKLEEIGKSNNHIIVAGIASNGSLDWDEESIDLDSLRSSWNDYMENPVLRYMHGKDARHPDAIGRVIPEYVTENGETIKTEFRDGKPFIVAKISNAPDIEDIRVKIQEGVLRGFSIGGRANRVKDFSHKLGKDVNKIFVKRLSEISIVDLPANKEGFFDVVKGCVGNNCSYDIYNNENYEGIKKEFPENDNSKNIQLDKLELEDTMAENIEMEMSELEKFVDDRVETVVSKMVSDQETVEKLEAGDAAVKEAQDLRARIKELEEKVTAMAEQLKAQPQETMKSEDEVTEDEVIKTEDAVKNDRVEKLEAELKEIKESPLYKAEQDGSIEKDETVERVSHLGSILKAHYGGN
jgi:hypothetical protein